MPQFEWNAILEGRPASKKNNRRNFRNVSLPSEAYVKFNKSALEQLRGKQPDVPYAGDVIVELEQHIKGKYKQDSDNFVSSIFDVLMDAGVLADDDQVVEHHAYKHRGAKDWRSEIHVVSIE